jgi:hypothetical protein
VKWKDESEFSARFAQGKVFMAEMRDKHPKWL